MNSVVLALALSAATANADVLHDISNAGTQGWATAARSGRADMLILGDSVVWVNGYGWDHGIAKAASSTFGLAGTGLITDAGLNGQGYGASTEYGYYGGGFSVNLSDIPAAQQGYALRTGSPADTVGSGAVGGPFGFFVGPTYPTSAAYNWDLYMAGGAGGGSTAAYRRIATIDSHYNYNQIQSLPTVSVPQLDTGLSKTTFSFSANPYGDAPQEIRLDSPTNLSIFYSRLIEPGAHGVTVSSLGYGGKDTHQFYNDVWTSMSPVGRQTYLQSLVDGSSSGKLNIVLAEGLNDRNHPELSINGVGPDNSAAGFHDNVSSLISVIRGDWAADGYANIDLSFTLVGSYQDTYEATDGSGPLHAFAAQEMTLAENDPQISFVDLYDDAPNFATANALGYSLDGVHPTPAGADYYGSLVMNVIATPEPTTLGICCVGLLLARRRTQ